MSMRERMPFVPVAMIALGLVLGLVSGRAMQRRMRASLTVDQVLTDRPADGQAVFISRAVIDFSGQVLATEFDARDPKGDRHYRWLVVKDPVTGRALPTLMWRDTFLDARTVDGQIIAEVRGTIYPLDRSTRAELAAALPSLHGSNATVYLDEMDATQLSPVTVFAGLIGLGLGVAGLVGVAGHLRPAGATLPARRPTIRARAGSGRVFETRRTCRACNHESPSASRVCGHCHAPIEVEYFVAGAIPFEGFERFVPHICRVLGVSEYQARKPLARLHTALPYQHLDGFHVKGPGASAPYRIIGRGIPSLVNAQALAATLGEVGVQCVVVGSDELVTGPFPRKATSLVHDDTAVTFRFEQGEDVEERTVAWNRITLIVFSADVPMRGTMTLASALTEGIPRDASSYLIDLYERDSSAGIRIAEDAFYRWEFLGLAGSERPADRFGRLMDLLQARVPAVDIHYVTGMYRGDSKEWRLNFYSRLSYLVGDKAGWARQEGPPKLEGYEMLEKLGEGAMGAVYKARQKKLGRIVAVKVVAPHLAAEQKFVARFEAEARAVASLAHPNIVQVMDLIHWGNRYFMIMEFVEGMSLQQVIRNSPRLPEAQALRVGLQVARALEHAARRGIVHRDVKPDNIFVTLAGDVKLGDWGLAKDLEADLGLTDTGTAVGTPYYMSPEQARARKDLDFRSDVYSLGATLFHALTGRPPFRGASPTEVLMAHLQTPPPDARNFAPEVSEATARLLKRMLAKEPGQRCSSPAEMLQLLEHGLAAVESPQPVGV